MTHEEILRERVAKLELQMTHLTAKLDDTHQKVEEMHAILLQATGGPSADRRPRRHRRVGVRSAQVTP